jgi:hypothetical protein
LKNENLFGVATQNVRLMQSAAVDFITVLRARFLYEFFAKAKIYLEKAAKTTFV